MSEGAAVILIISVSVLAEVLMIVLMSVNSKKRDKTTAYIFDELSEADKRFLLRTPLRRLKNGKMYIPSVCCGVKELHSGGARISLIIKNMYYPDYRDRRTRIVKGKLSKEEYTLHPIKENDRVFVDPSGFYLKIGWDVR